MGFLNNDYEDKINSLQNQLYEIKAQIDLLEASTGMTIKQINTMIRNGWKIKWKAERL